jgi:hypothetical protein
MDQTNVLDGSTRWPTRARILARMAEAAPSEADLRALRLRYNAAYSAYQACLIAVNEAALSGQGASSDLLKKEAEALRELTDARGQLLAAMVATAPKNH